MKTQKKGVSPFFVRYLWRRKQILKRLSITFVPDMIYLNAMKSKNLFPFRILSWLVMLCPVFLTACLEGDDDSIRQNTSVLFVNVYNDAPQGLDIRIDDREWPNGHKVYDSIGSYNVFYSGEKLISAFPVGTASAIVSQTKDLKPDSLYTCFITGKSGEARMFFLPDTMTRPSSRQARIRLVNLSPDIAKMDLEIVDSAKIITDLDYLTAQYFTIDTSDHSYDIYVPSRELPLASFQFKALPGRLYTLYTKGLLSREGKDSLGITYFQQP